MSTLTSLLSPADNITLRHPTSRFGGSPALAGSAAYTCATSAPARLPVFLTVNVTFPASAFKFE